MKKFAFIGAGSFGFTRELVRDMLTYPAFDDAVIHLMDIDEERLAYIRRACERINADGGHHAAIRATTDRAQALEGADGVVITVLAGGPSVFRTDIEIPKAYGVDLCVGDTRGPAGIFRFLRTAPVLLDICRDIERLCPDAYVLNYTNPMALLCRYLQERTALKITGLCHSVQHTAAMLAGWIGADMADVAYTCAGINHQAFYLTYTWKGEDAYPLLREAAARPEVYEQEPVRNELFRHLGYYPTESSGHNSEYYPWFRKRPDLIERYCTHGAGWNPGAHAYILNEYFAREHTWKREIEDWFSQESVDLDRGQEYAACIFNALLGDHAPFTFNGNVRNDGYITNLPPGCCVEIPVTATQSGLSPQAVGALPAHLGVLVSTAAGSEELAVRGCADRNREDIFRAVLCDPLTSAVLSLEEIRRMTDDMFAVGKDYIGF